MKSSKSQRVAAIVLCAGKGERSGLPFNKMFFQIGDQTVLDMTLKTFADSKLFCDILCAASPVDYDETCEIAIGYGARVCLGGVTRSDSVRRALSKLDPKTDIVLIHDGARPFVLPMSLEAAIDAASEFGGGVVGVPSVDAVKMVSADGEILQSLPKAKLFNAQTPQAFRYSEIMDAYARVSGDYGDDCEVYQLAGYKPHIVEGYYTNRKITNPSDIFNLSTCYHIGFGYDVHQMVEGRDLILGGVHIPFEKGLLGHSDADVLTHALMDALLSTAQLPDIGVLFPDTDPKYKDCSSIRLLERVRGMLAERRIKVIGVSCVIMAERPKLASRIQLMIDCIARTLGISPTAVNISATTTEKLGIVGDGAGMAAAACVLTGD